MASDIATHKGNYVRVEVKSRRHASLCQPEGEWTTGFLEGILSFGRNGSLKLNGEKLGTPFEDIEVLSVKTLFVPAHDAITHLCLRCEVNHPIIVAMRDMRIYPNHSFRQTNRCSLCGIGGSRVAICDIPPKFWKLGKSATVEEFEKEFASDVFFTKMKDWNTPVFLKAVAMETYDKNYKYRFTIAPKCGDYFTAYAMDPPPASLWRSWKNLSDFKPYVQTIRCGSQVIWES